MHIGIVTGTHPCRNPRVAKEADALIEAGYEVSVVRPVISDDLQEEDAALLASVGWANVVSVDLRSVWQGSFTRLQRRLGSKLTALGWERPQALGYGVRQALKQTRALQADLYIGHQEVGAWVCAELAAEGFRVGADLEDWYSRDLLPSARKGRPMLLLEECEKVLLKYGVHVTTTSESMAGAMASAYDVPHPTVIYNAFPWSDRSSLDHQILDRESDGRPSLHWVSQTIGPGRGLETLCLALRNVKTPVQVHLRGNCRDDYREQLHRAFPTELGHTLHLHGLVSSESLLSRIAEHDIGLALEKHTPDSRNYTVTNKILHYLLGGLAVVATDTEGQREVADKAGDAVQLCSVESAEQLASTLNTILSEDDFVLRAKKRALCAARDHFSWERQIPRLLGSVERAVNRGEENYRVV